MITAALVIFNLMVGNPKIFQQVLIKQFDNLIRKKFSNKENYPFRHFVYQYERNDNPQQECNCYIQGFLYLKNATCIEHYLDAGELLNGRKLKVAKIDSVKELLQNNKINFDSVATIEESVAY
ncbi:19649_t:CDS:2, partial [Racocetra persica]